MDIDTAGPTADGGLKGRELGLNDRADCAHEDAAEQPIERQATVYLEAVSGVLPRVRVTTIQGTAAVPVFATGLRPGEKVRIKAGWKYFPGVDDITLEVV